MRPQHTLHSDKEFPYSDNACIEHQGFQASSARAHESTRSVELRVGALRMSLSRYEVWLGHERIALTGLEFVLLEKMMKAPLQPLSYHSLAQAMYGEDGLQHIDVISLVKQRICQLRKKLEGTGYKRHIHNIRGTGYRLHPPQQRAAEECTAESEDPRVSL